MHLAALLLALAPTDEPALPELAGVPVPWEHYARWLIAERGEKRLAEIALQRALVARARATGIEQVGPRTRADELARRIALAERTIDEAALHAAWEERHGPHGVLTTLFALRERIVVRSDPAAAAASRARETSRLIERRTRFDSDRATPENRLLKLGRLRASDWPATVAEVLTGLAADTWTAPLEAHGALYVFRVQRAARVPFEDVAPALREQLERAPVSPVELSRLLDGIWGALELRPLPALLDPQAPLEAPAAELNGAILTRDDLARRVARSEGRSLIFAYCGERVARDAARAAGIAIDPGRVVVRARQIEERERARLAGGNAVRWRAALARGGEGTVQARRRHARRAELELLQDALVRATRAVSEQDVLELWQARYGPRGRNLVVRVLVRAVGPQADVEHDLRRLAELVDRGQDFGTLITLNSDDPLTREENGRPPARFPYEDLDDDQRLALEHARLGDLIGPLFYRRLPWSPPAPTRAGTAWRPPDEPLEQRGYHVLVQLVDDVRTPLSHVTEALAKELAERPPTVAERARWVQAELERVGWGTAER